MKRSLVTLCGLLVVALTGCFQHPSDEVFRQRFAREHTAFRDVADAVDASGVTGFITPEQQAKVVTQHGSSLLQDDAFRLVRREDGAVLFGYSAYGLAIAGSSKGIARIPAKSLRFYKVLPSNSAWPREEGDFAKLIEGDWYIYVIN